MAKRVNGKPFVYGQELENLLDLDSLDQHIPRSPMFNEHAFGFGINDVGDIDADGEEGGFALGEEEEGDQGEEEGEEEGGEEGEEVVPRRVWKPTHKV